MPRLLSVFLAACAAASAAMMHVAAPPPITGSGLAAVDTVMLAFMEKHCSLGGQLAVTFPGRLVLSHG